MIAEYIQRGESLDYRNSTEELIPAGAIVDLKTRIGVAGMDIAPGELGSIHVMGVFAIPKDTSTEVKLGAALYYDSEGGKLVTDGEGKTPAGYAAADAAEADTAARVNIGFPPAAAAGPAPAATTTLAQLTDVDVGTKDDGQVLYWDNGAGKWKAKAIPAGIKTLAELTDVDVATKSDGDALTWTDGESKWKPKAVSEAV